MVERDMVERCARVVDPRAFVEPVLPEVQKLARRIARDVLREARYTELVAALEATKHEALVKIRRYADDHDDEMVPILIDEALVIIDAALAAAGHKQGGGK